MLRLCSLIGTTYGGNGTTSVRIARDAVTPPCSRSAPWVCGASPRRTGSGPPGGSEPAARVDPAEIAPSGLSPAVLRAGATLAHRLTRHAAGADTRSPAPCRQGDQDAKDAVRRRDRGARDARRRRRLECARDAVAPRPRAHDPRGRARDERHRRRQRPGRRLGRRHAGLRQQRLRRLRHGRRRQRRRPVRPHRPRHLLGVHVDDVAQERPDHGRGARSSTRATARSRSPAAPAPTATRAARWISTRATRRAARTTSRSMSSPGTADKLAGRPPRGGRPAVGRPQPVSRTTSPVRADSSAASVAASAAIASSGRPICGSAPVSAQRAKYANSSRSAPPRTPSNSGQ